MNDQAMAARPFRESRAAHLVRAGVVGVVAGLIAVGFKWALAEAEAARGLLLAWLHGSAGGGGSGGGGGWGVWGLGVCGFAVVAFGVACLAGWMVQRLAPDAPGSGIPHVKGVLLHVRTMGWRWLIPVKFIGGMLGIGAGLSLGREGPTVQMGAGVGHALAELLRVPERLRPQLLSCGAGAGLAAAFNAPLAGFLFVIEELHRELSARTFAGALVAALCADVVARALAGSLPSFEVSGFAAAPLSGLPVAVLLGALGAVLGVAFNRSLLASSGWAGRSGLPVWVKPGIAAALCGLAAWRLPDAVGGGHATAEHLLADPLAPAVSALAVLMLAKFVLTVVSYASGAPGGIFAPMLLMGAVTGALAARAVPAAAPSLAPYATAFSILGMAAVFSGSVRAPLTGIVLMVEMTGNYEQLLSLGVTCLTADLVASALGGRPLYEALLEADLRRRPPVSSPGEEASEPRSVYVGVQRGSGLEGKAIREAELPAGCLIVLLERGGRELLPEADVVLFPGDHLTVLVPADEPTKAMEVVSRATGI